MASITTQVTCSLIRAHPTRGPGWSSPTRWSPSRGFVVSRPRRSGHRPWRPSGHVEPGAPGVHNLHDDFLLTRRPTDRVRRGEDRDVQKSDARAQRQQSTVPWSPPPPCSPTGSQALKRVRSRTAANKLSLHRNPATSQPSADRESSRTTMRQRRRIAHLRKRTYREKIRRSRRRRRNAAPMMNGRTRSAGPRRVAQPDDVKHGEHDRHHGDGDISCEAGRCGSRGCPGRAT